MNMVKKSVLLMIAGLILIPIPEPITSVLGVLFLLAGIALYLFG